MKKRSLTIIAGLALAIIFGFRLFAFQVRQTEVAVVTTFGKYSRSIEEPGLYWRGPLPIQKVHKFDNRIHTFERIFEQTSTRDRRNLLITVYIGWKVNDPKTFLERFASNDVKEAEKTLESLIRDTKNAVIGRHPFRHLISTNSGELQFDEIENEMLSDIQPKAENSFGIQIELLGIKAIGIPESTTTKVFDRMKEERQRLVKQFSGEGDREAQKIRSNADAERQGILSDAEAEATRIRGQGDAKAAEYYAVFEEQPELAIFLRQLKSVEESLKERATVIIGPETPPFNILMSGSGDLPMLQQIKPEAPSTGDSK